MDVSKSKGKRPSFALKSIKAEIILSIISTVVVILIASTLQSFRIEIQKQLITKQAQYQETLNAIDLLHSTNNDLTYLVQFYLNTGDERFLNYYQQTRSMRMGKTPWPENYNTYWIKMTANAEYEESFIEAFSIRERINFLAISDESKNILLKAEYLSNKITNTQLAAISHYQNSQHKLANDLMYNNSYTSAKARFVF